MAVKGGTRRRYIEREFPTLDAVDLRRFLGDLDGAREVLQRRALELSDRFEPRGAEELEALAARLAELRSTIDAAIDP